MAKAKGIEEEMPDIDTEDFSVDMSQAKTFEPLPERVPFLAAVNKWIYGKTDKGKKVDYEFTILEPEANKNRKVSESVSLENEYTLGRYQTILLALGFPEAYVKSKTHKPPKTDEVMGMQATIWCRTRKSDTYGDRSIIARIRPAADFKEASAATF
jgi:hypothetical protein